MNWWMSLLARLLRAGPPRRRANPFLGAYRLRYEIGAVAAVLGVASIGPGTHYAAPLVIVLTAGIALVWSRPLRVWLGARFQVVLMQHRLRSAFRGAALTSFSGRAPAILWTSPRSAGVRVVLSVPAGLEVADIRALRGVLAAACFAADVLVERHERYANLVVLYVVTRIPKP